MNRAARRETCLYGTLIRVIVTNGSPGTCAVNTSDPVNVTILEPIELGSGPVE